MTPSRLGPPQRSSSSTNILQRSSQRRTLSQQYSSSSPTRRHNESFVDLAFEVPDAAPARYGTIPRIGGSRLKLEISKDSKNPVLLESPKPTSDATPTWQSSLPPRGRPQLPFDVPSVNLFSPSAAAQGGHNDISPVRPMPLPVRPGQHAPPALDKSRNVSGNAAKKDTRPKPYVLEVPTAAPHYTPNGHADFFPWTGNHPEDQFSEPVIRQGFFDKAQMTQNETGSAKSSIFPTLKHKSGLQTLSSLFTGVLAQRRAHGQIISNSTFKPPPRVTVTDTKREMWLKDLANPTIPLRRLSRSIPHGIRGKVLLDQSLSKHIPIERAVWLAKCVGANELRSFRRKGASGTFAMGGEAKWIRDFTVCVEQFVENIIASCGGKDFKSRISYAIRLSAHFHAEYLLDREHYMDWLVSSLENSPQGKTPIWLLITQIYWKDLLQYRKYGRRLSAALLGHFSEALNHQDHDVLAPLANRLQLLLRELMLSHPESFISPKVWAKFRGTILSSIAADEQDFRSIFTAIDSRNSRLTTPAMVKGPGPRQNLIRQLDMVISEPFSNELTMQYWQLDDDKAMLIRTVLEWSTSSHRPGATKIFVGTRIIRSWGRLGANVTESVLSFLDSAACESGRNKASTYHLISELARSEHFSTPTYLQWLIARGGLYEKAEVARDGPCATRLLAELPTHNLSDGIIVLRRTLLQRAAFSVTEEEEKLRACMILINRSLPGMQANLDLMVEPQNGSVVGNLSRLIPQLSRTSRSEIGLWLRQKVGLQMLQPTIPPLNDWDASLMKGGTSAITASEFSVVRRYLELIDDYSMLADVLKIVTSSNDAEVLASIADTLNLHLETFAAIGALRELLDVLLSRIRSLTEDHDSLSRVFLVSLSGLTARIPEYELIAQQLSQELARNDRKTAADACSPVSDHMASVLLNAKADFTDEIEKVLASGTSMDQATLERLFRRIVVRLEASWEKSPEQQRGCCLLLTRLRTFDAQQFDVLMTAWIHRFQQLKSRPSMMQVFSPLISFGCIALNDMIASCSAIVEREMSIEVQMASRISQEALALIMLPSDLSEVMTIEEAYRLRIKQVHMQKDYPIETLSVIRRALECSVSDHGDKALVIESLAGSMHEGSELQELLQRLVIFDSESTSRALVLPLSQSTDTRVVAEVGTLIDKLILPGLQGSSSGGVQTEMILSLADDLTLPFCQLKLTSIFAIDGNSSPSSDDVRLHRLGALESAIGAALTAGNTTWACIVPLLDISIAQHLHSRAEARFLALFPSPKSSPYDTSDIHNRGLLAENLIYIIAVTACTVSATGSMPSNAASSLAVDIVEILNNVWLLLSSSQSSAVKGEVVSKWLPLVISFGTIHASAFEPTKSGHEYRAKALLALAALILELEALNTKTEAVRGLIEQTFDLALVMADSLPDDMRQHCIRSLHEAISNSRICYLFSFPTHPSEGLFLSHKEKGSVFSVSPVGNGSGGPVSGQLSSGPGESKGLEKEKLVPFPLRRWEMLGEPTPNVGENDTSLSLTLFGARRS